MPITSETKEEFTAKFETGKGHLGKKAINNGTLGRYVRLQQHVIITNNESVPVSEQSALVLCHTFHSIFTLQGAKTLMLRTYLTGSHFLNTIYILTRIVLVKR